MKVCFYGTRGSCPTPGPLTLKYGGNTACTLVESKNGNKLILDAGTGIRNLGNELVKSKDNIYLLITHNHYDHIQGFPFFKPIYQKNRKIQIYPAVTQPNHPHAIIDQMQGSYSPINHDLLTADIKFHLPDWSNQPISINGFKVSRLEMNHPNGGMSYLVEVDGKRIAYVTDNELHGPNCVSSELQWSTFVSGVDLLIHDGQYIESDMPLKIGWGHSLISESIALAQGANVKNLAIYSHDPERTDEELDRWQNKIDELKLDFNVFISIENQEINI
jgi:phosphoribosyl 1,2-cyclic phosphodiesterase